jgi:undecaprenyl pyrophosphate synthase
MIFKFLKIGGGREEVAQTVYTYVSKCKNDKIKGEKKKIKTLLSKLLFHEIHTCAFSLRTSDAQ